MCYFLASWEKGAFLFFPAEAIVQSCSVKKVFLEIAQNSKENTCTRVSFLIKLQASGFFWIPFFLIAEVSFLHILYEFHEIKLNVMKYTLNCVSWNSMKEIFHSILAFWFETQNFLMRLKKVYWNWGISFVFKSKSKHIYI